MTETAPSGRPYERTHPWLDFRFDARRLKYSDWIALGECAAFGAQIGGAPLNPEAAREIDRLYLSKGALATTAIEGNTLSEAQALARVEGDLELPPSQQYLGQEIDNIVAAYRRIVDEISKNGCVSLNVSAVKRMNAEVLRDLTVDDYVAPGEIRETDVTVGRYLCPGWSDAKHLLARLCETLADFRIPDENRPVFAILKAIFAHVVLVWIHPFGDGNGRTARLMEFAILLEAGFPPPACHLLSNHYNRTRAEYYRQLDRASRAERGIYGFVSYAVAGLTDGFRELAGVFLAHHRRAAWIEFVHRELGYPRNWMERRRRLLALSLAEVENGAPIADLPYLNQELMRAYGQVDRRTLFRDVEALAARGVLARGPAGIMARRDRLVPFPPLSNRPASGSAPDKGS